MKLEEILFKDWTPEMKDFYDHISENNDQSTLKEPEGIMYYIDCDPETGEQYVVYFKLPDSFVQLF